MALMSMVERRGFASLDALLSHVRVAHPAAGFVVLAWDRRYQRAAVMGLLDGASDPLDVSPQVVQRLTWLVSVPLSRDVFRFAYPDADVNLSGQVVLNLPIDEPVWARVLSHVELRVQAGLKAPSEVLLDAVWCVLEAAHVPSGSVGVQRLGVFPEAPDDLTFEPVWVAEHRGGAGARVPWGAVRDAWRVPHVAAAMSVVVNELALRREREMCAEGGLDRAVMVMSAVVDL